MGGEFPPEYLRSYKRLNVGAVKADFYRYAVLYKKGGIYLDIDSGVNKKFDDFILPSNCAVVTDEDPPTYYVQWALIYEAGHPFLKKTLEKVLKNIQENNFPHNVHKTTGPTVYTEDVKECLAENPEMPYRFLEPDYDKNLKFKYKLGKYFLYKDKSEHWKKLQLKQNIINPESF